MNQKGFANIILVVIVVAVLAGTVGYFALVKKQSEPVTQQISPTPTQTSNNQPTTAPQSSTANWKTYQNEKYGFEIKYPGSGIGYELVTSVAHFVPKEDYDMPPERHSLILIRLTSPNENLEFYVLPNTKKLTPRNFAEMVIRQPCFIEKSEIILNGVTAYELKISAYNGAYDDVPEQKTIVDQACGGMAAEKVPTKHIVFVPLKMQDKILRISYYINYGSGRTPPSEEILNTVNKIISTFKLF